ncbi:MAG: MBOAT family O-acyltransferase [Candidatus Methylomirabilis sp.]
MVALNDLSFLASIAATAFLFHALTAPLWRRCVLLGASGAFLASFGSWTTLRPVVAFAGACTLAILAAARWRGGAMALLAVLVAGFALLKGYVGAAFVDQAATTVGISYILFRTVQILVDLSDGALDQADVHLGEVMLFLLSFLTFTAGPIQRYEAFRAQLAVSDRIMLADIDPRAVFGRTVYGYVKLTVLAPVLMVAHMALVQASLPPSQRIGLAAAAFMLWIYVNFSGYMDIVIGLGRLFGFALPENFTRPDRAVNFLDLWSRWHITLSQTLLTYVFNPLVGMLLVRQIAGPVTAGAVGYLTVFFLIGWWHGPASRFALSGLLLGLAALVNKFWQAGRQRWPGLATELPYGSVISGGLGLGACAVALVPTWPLFALEGELLEFFVTSGHLIGALVVASAVGCAVRLLGLALDRLAAKWVPATWFRLATAPAFMGLVAAALVGLILMQSNDIPAVAYYQRF